MTAEELENIMKKNEKLVATKLEEGRNVLPNTKRKKRFDYFDLEHTPCNNQKPEFAKLFNCSVDFYEHGVLVQRRFFDKDGYAEQDVDFVHKNPFDNHFFPHVHVWVPEEKNEKKTSGRTRFESFIHCIEEKENEKDGPQQKLEQMAWVYENNVSSEEYIRIMEENPRIACSYPRGIKIRFSGGLEFSVKYKDEEAFLTGGCLYGVAWCVETKEGAQFFDDLDCLVDEGTIAGERIKDICSKWKVTWSA